MWRFFITNVVPVLYVVGVIYIVFIQQNRIRNLEKTLKNAQDFVSMFDLEKVKRYSKFGEEMARFDYDKKVQEITEKASKNLATAGRMVNDYITLLIGVIQPLAGTWYLKSCIDKVPEGEAKRSALYIEQKIIEFNEKEKISPLVGMLGILVGQSTEKPKSSAPGKPE